MEYSTGEKKAAVWMHAGDYLDEDITADLPHLRYAKVAHRIETSVDTRIQIESGLATHEAFRYE